MRWKFWKKKKEEIKPEQPEKKITELEEFCSGDPDLYDALYNTMFLDPRKVETSMTDAVKKAKKFEKSKDFLRAVVWYEIAGALAIYKGKEGQVIEYFSRCKTLTGKNYLILNNAKEAVAKAQEYYNKYLK